MAEGSSAKMMVWRGAIIMRKGTISYHFGEPCWDTAIFERFYVLAFEQSPDVQLEYNPMIVLHQ